MSLIAELLKANAVNTNALVLNAQSRIKLGVGDLLRLPQGDQVQVIRQGMDLVVVMDTGEGKPPERIVVEGFFAAGSLGMVQVGPDGAAEMVTPRSLVAQAAAPEAVTAEAAKPQEAPVEAKEQVAGKIEAQVFQDLRVQDMHANPFGNQPVVSDQPELVQVFDSVVQRDEPLKKAAPVADFSRGDQSVLINVLAPDLAEPVNGVWINAQNKLTNYVISGQGIDGLLVDVQLDSASGVRMLHRANVVNGSWSVTLSGAEIGALGEGRLVVAATHVSEIGQAFSAATKQVLTIDTLPPQVPTITAPAAAADGILTADDVATQDLRFTVFAEAGSKVSMTLTDQPGHSSILTGEADQYGICVLDIKPALATLQDGLVIYSVLSTDAAGNTRQSVPPSFNLRQTLPGQPVAALLAADDHGALNNDGVTNVTDPTFKGTASVNAAGNSTKYVRVYKDTLVDGKFDGVGSSSELIDTLEPDAAGNFSYGPAHLSGDGAYQFLFVAEDRFGNRSAATPVKMVLDTQVALPTLNLVTGDDKLSYTETLASTVNFSGTSEARATVKLTFSNGDNSFSVETTADAQGNWSRDVFSNVVGASQAQSLRYGFGTDFNGYVNVAVQQTDLAGNVSESTARPVYVRTQPVAQVSALGFGLGTNGLSDDTGASATDGVTKKSQFQLTGVGPASTQGLNNMVVKVYIDKSGNGVYDPTDDTLLATLRTDAGGTFHGLVPDGTGRLDDGNYNLITVVTDELSGTTSVLTGIKQVLNVTVDTQVANVTFDDVAIDNIVTTDELASGFLTITGHGEPLGQVNLSLKAGTFELTSYTNLQVDGTGRWTARIAANDIIALGSSAVTMRATQTDLAGNSTVLSNSVEKLFDIKLGVLDAPANLRLQAADDTGSSTSDGITKVSQGLTFTGTSQTGYKIKLFDDTNNNGVLDNAEVLGATYTVGDDGTFAIQVNLAQGAHTIRVQAYDEFGQTSGPSAAYGVVVDQSASAPVILHITDDNTINALEARTNAATVNGTAEPLSTLTLRFFSADNTQPTVTKTLVTQQDGAWSIDLTPADVLALQNDAGNVARWHVEAQQTDKAGNVSAWSQQSFVIDTAPPATVSASNDQAAFDYNHDQARAWRNPFGDDPIVWSELFGFRSGFATPKTLQVAVGLLAEVHQLDQVKLMWGSTNVLHTVTAEDIGRGYALVDITGDAIQSNRASSGRDAVDVKATFIDVAGNESTTPVTVMSGVQVTLAGSPPSLTPVLDSYNAFDTNNSTYYSRNSINSSDLVRKAFNVAGIASAGDELVIFNDINLDGIVQAGEDLLGWDSTNGVAIRSTATADSVGNYNTALYLAPGNYNLRTISVSAAGASPSNSQNVVIDIAVPDSPVLSGTSLQNKAYIGMAKRDQGVTLTGTAEPYATINIQLVNTTTGVTGSIYRNVTANSQGNWSAMVGVVQWGQVGDGVLSVNVSQTDRAGNTSNVYNLDGNPPQVTFDTQVAAPVVFAVTSDDTLNATEAAVSNVIRGNGEPGATIELTFTGSNRTVGPVTTEVSSQGIWNYTLTSAEIVTTFGNGLLAISAKQKDLAGNVSVITTRTVIVDTLAFAPQIAAIAGDDKINAGERSIGVDVTVSAEPQALITIKATGHSGQVVIKTTTATESGAATVTLSAADINLLGDGICTVTAQQTDKAGNTSIEGARTVLIATGPLTTPVVLAAVTGDDQVLVAEQSQGVTLQGTAPPSTTVYLTLTGRRGVLTKTIDVGANGQWSYGLDTDALQQSLGAGTVTATAYAVNDLQQSTDLMTHVFTIELQEPSASIARVASDNYVNAKEAVASVAIEGGGLAGHTVVVQIRGKSGTLADRTATVGDDRKWSISLSVGDMAVLGNGTVSVSVVQKASTDPAAAVSISTTSSFTIDTQAPGAPNASDTSAANAYNATQSEIAGGVTVAEAADGVVVAVALPADAVAGDRFTLRWGGQEVNQTITATMVPEQGARVVNVLVPAGTLITQSDGIFDITVVYTDIAGNVSAAQTIASSLVVSAPPAAPSVNSVYADGYINATEFTQVQTTGKAVIAGNAPDGGTIRLTLTRGEVSIVLDSLAVTGGAWSGQFTPAQLLSLGEGRITASAVYTNAKGAVSSPTLVDFVFDKTAPLAPASDSANALLAGEANARNELAGGLIRNNGATTEAASPVTVNVALASDVQSGDALTLYWGRQQVNVVVNQSDLSRGYAQVVVNAVIMSTEGDNDALVVNARITDKAGNAGALYQVWTGKVDAIPLSPEVNAISTDGYLNAAEAGLGWAVTGQGSVNGKVVVTLLGTNKDASGNFVTIVSNEISVLVDSVSGIPKWTYSLTQAQAAYLGDGRIKITSIQYDENRNASDPGKNPSDPSIRYFNIDLQTPANPTVDPVTANNSVSFAEGQSDVTISGTGETDATVSVTIAHGSVTKNKSATAVAGVWSVILTPAELAELGGGSVPLVVTAKQTDLAGNVSGNATRSFLYTTDMVLPPTFVSVTGITPGADTAFNLADLNAVSVAQPFTVRGTGTAGNGLRLSVTNDSGTRLSYLLTVELDGTWTKAFTSAELTALGQGKVNFAAVQISSGGDESTTTSYDPGTSDKSFLIDTVAPSLAAAVVTANGNNGNAKAGDVITVTVQASERLALTGIDASHIPSVQLDFGSGQGRTALYNAALSTAAGADKLVFTYTVQAGDSATTVTPSQTIVLNGVAIADLANNSCAPTIGNISTATLRVDTIAPAAPAILNVDAVALGTPGQMLDVDGVTTINKINASEAAVGVKVRISLANGTLVAGSSPLAGDTVQLAWTTNNSSTSTLSKQITSGDISLGYVDVTVNSNTIGLVEDSVTLKSRLIDAAGNVSSYSSQQIVLVDTVAPAKMAVNTWLGDDKVNAAEAGSLALDMMLRGTGLETGATVVATLRQGSTTLNLTTVAGSNPGDWSISSTQMKNAVNALADGGFTVTISQTDAAGNPGLSTTGSYFIDRAVPNKPTITSVPSGDDGWINLRDAQTVGVTVLVSLLNTNAVAGDTLVVGGFSNDVRYTLTPADITAKSVAVALPASAVLQAAGDAPSIGKVINARVEDQGGNVSLSSSGFSVNVDTNILPPVVDMTQGAAMGVSKNQAKAAVYFYGSGVESGAQVSVFFTGVLGTTLLSTSTGLANGTFKVALQPNDMASLGDGAVNYSVVQTDNALNTSVGALGSFDLRLSTPLPTLLNMTDDNVVSALEANSLTNYTYQGLGVAGALVKVNFYVRDTVTGLYKTTAEITQKTDTVKANGYWSVTLSKSDYAALSAAGQGTVQVLATQTDDGSESGVADLEFYVDRLPPALLTSTNLFTYSQTLDNVVWSKSNAVIKADQVAAPAGTLVAGNSVAPFGTVTADGVVVSNGSVNEAVYQNASVTAGQSYTYSIYVKNGTLGLPVIELTTSGDSTRRQWFDLSKPLASGAVGSTSGTVTAKSLTDEGNGWFRASITFTAATTTTDTFYISTRPSNGSTGNVTGNGVGVSTYLWGAQLEAVATPTSVPTAYKQVDALPALTLFDGNGDGANNDGLLVTFAEPVAVNELIKTTAYTPTAGKTMGSDFRVEAVDSKSINGQFYATKFKLFLDSDSTMAQGNTITISKSSIVDAGGNLSSANQVLTMPNISVPGLPTPPVDIMSDNRINADEASNVTRLTYSDSNTAAQLKAALGGLLQTKVNGVLADEVIPKANFVSVDISFNRALKLLQGQLVTASVKVTYLDGTSANITVYTTGTPTTQSTASTTYRFTAAQATDLSNISTITYNNDVNTGYFMIPQTLDPTGQTTSGIKISSTGSLATGNLLTKVDLTLDFPNTVRLASGKQSAATVRVYYTDLNQWIDVQALSQFGTAATALDGFTRMSYTYSINRPIAAGNNFYWDTVPTNLSLNSSNSALYPNLAVLTTGANAPVISTQYATSVVVKTADLAANAVMTTQLLDQNLNAIAGTLDTVNYTTSNPNQVLYTQSLGNALSAAGRKLQMFVDGKAVGTATTMGIDTVTCYLFAQWENQNGGQSGWGSQYSLQAGATMTARLTVTFKTVAGVTPASVEVLVSAVGGTNINSQPLNFTGKFVNAATGAVIDASTVSNITYKGGSVSQIMPNMAEWLPWGIDTSQYVDLPASAWAGQTEGLKQITAQITTSDGSLTSVFSAPKQIRLDMSVGGIKDVALLTDTNSNGKLDAGDVVQVRFTENVAFTFSALPATFGTNPLVTPVGSENGYAQVWNVTLGAGATIAAGNNFTLQARKVFDQAGNDNGTGAATTGTVPLTIMTKAGLPIIDNVSDDNVITSTATATPVKVNLTKALKGDVVRLLMDGIDVGSQTVAADGATSVTFSVAGNQWGADGERQLTTVLTRSGVSTTSALRSVYVAADSSHWSQESTYAGKINWFNPDAIVQTDGTKVTTWAASTGGLTVANAVANTTIKIVDVLTGHAYLVTDANSVFYETAVSPGVYLYQAPGAMPTMARSATDTSIPTAGFTDFTMFKPTVQGAQTMMVHPYYRYTSNTVPVTYVPGNVVGGASVTVQPNTLLMRNESIGYSFSAGSSNVSLYDYGGWNVGMANAVSVGSWQMVTQAATAYKVSSYNQMRLNATAGYGGYTPDANNTLANWDYSLLAANNGNKLFRIGGGAGILGDQIDITVATGLAYQQEIGAYLASKFQSTGSVVARNAVLTNTNYDLTVSNVPGTLIDETLMLNDIVSSDTVLVGGADYVNTAAGNDVVKIKDLAFRHIDGGLGYDTLMLAPGFTGHSTIVLADMASNYRGLSATDTTGNQRVNDAGYHRLAGFEKIDLVQDGETENRRQIVTVSASDVNSLSETNTLELRLGQEDVVKGTGFADNLGVDGVYQVNGTWYDHKYTQTVAGQAVTLYTDGGDRMPEAISFKTVAALNQVQMTFDHAMLGNVLAGDFLVTTYSGPAIYASSALSVNLRQGVALTMSAPLNSIAKISYIGGIADEAGRGFRHNTWIIGTNNGDTLNGAVLSAAEQAKGVTFMGGNGADTITGTSGADLIIGGLGADVLTGGRGSDTFYFRNEITGSGSAGGLGGTSGDVITDFTFNDADPSQNDRIDLSALFETSFKATGNATIDASALIAGQFLDVRKVTNFQTGKQDLQLWVDRDGGGLYGQLATISNGGANLPDQYAAVETNQVFLTRLLDEGRLVVSHF